MQEDPKLVSDFRFTNYLYVSALVLLYYDHFLTFGLEVNLIWMRPFGISSFLFCLNRYFLSLGNIVVAYSLFSTSISPSRSDNVCKHLSLYHEILLGIAQVIVCVNLSLRIYAIYARSRRVLVSLSCVFTVLVIVVLITNFYQRSIDPAQFGGCHITNVGLVEATKTATFWEVVFVYDVIIFSFFVRRALQLRKDFGRRTRRSDGPPTILKILIRDGFIYFIIMALANLINIFFLYFSDVSAHITIHPTVALPRPFTSTAAERSLWTCQQHINNNDVPPDSQPPSNSGRRAIFDY
ncbi:hypothetical protein VKT23_011111 [Stygiomarasmius scandens]|uniref:DUF6533 domain-containing protein n=1 Tax=Marasmiellus scandens TaxID=2682957 RepID=A0ABR1JDB3_9AGAR